MCNLAAVKAGNKIAGNEIVSAVTILSGKVRQLRGRVALFLNTTETDSRPVRRTRHLVPSNYTFFVNT